MKKEKNEKITRIIKNRSKFNNSKDLKSQSNYDSGKKQQKMAIDCLIKKGFYKPNGVQKKFLKNSINKKIKSRGYDLIKGNQKALSIIKFIEGKKGERISFNSKITFYELKSCSEETGKKILGKKIKTFGFTLTQNEIDNSNLLKKNYKFIFFNNYSKKYVEAKLEDFYGSRKKIKYDATNYKTVSVFINNYDLVEENEGRELKK